jgi:hypothetical protein
LSDKLARELQGEELSLRGISAALPERGYTTRKGVPYSASAVASILASC